MGNRRAKDVIKKLKNAGFESVSQKGSHKKLRKGKTIIIVSHRISSIKHADTIIVLEKGVLIQQGNHKELVQKDGYYKELYQQQGIDNKF